MKTTLKKTELLALILLATATITGCESFKSPSADYVKPGELCTDVSSLPDPNEPHKDQSVALRNVANQYGYGGKREESPERLLMQADSYFEQKRYHDSARLYKKYLNTADSTSAAPDLLAAIHYRIGFVASKKTFYTEAKGEFAQALQFAPMNDEYLFSYAKACYDSGDYQTADQQFATLVMRAPAYPEAQRYYGLTLLEGSNRANALQPLVSSVGALEAYTLLTDKYYAVGELELAAQMEAQTIQIAAQAVQPIPRFPHKEQILANAQNAAYAQTLAAAANPAAVAQYAQTVPGIPGITAPVAANPVAAPLAANPVAVAPVVPAATAATTATAPAAAPVQEPAPFVSHYAVAESAEPVAAPAVPGIPDFQAAQNEPVLNAPVAEPVPAQPAHAQNAAGQFAAFSAVEPVEPAKTTELVAQVPAKYAQISPVPAEQNRSVAEKAQPVETSTTQGPQFSYPEPQFTPEPEEYDGADDDDEEEWDDSAFATSGSAPAEPFVVAPQFTPAPAEQYAAAPQYADGNAFYQPQSVVQEFQPQQYSPDGCLQPGMNYEQPVEYQPQYPAEGFQQQAPEGYMPQYQNGGFQQYPNPSFSMSDSFEEEKLCVGYIRASRLNVSDLHYYAARLKDAVGAESVAAQPLAKETKEEENLTAHVAEKFVAENRRAARQPIAAVSSEEPVSAPKAVRLSSAEEAAEPDAAKRRVKASTHVGAGNPGLFVTSAATSELKTRLAFRPGSIEDSEDVEQNVPDALAVRVVRRAHRAPKPSENPIVVAPPRDPEAEWNLMIGKLDALVKDFDYLDENALVYYEPFAAADDEDEWDDAAFVTSGAPAQPAAVGGFGDYAAPVADAAPVPFQAPVYVAQVPRQQVPVQLPYAAPQVPVQQPYAAPQVPVQQPYAAPQVPVQQQAPVVSQRSQMTPEERLEAARRAGAQIVELSPEEYRHAVSVGLGSAPR